MTYNIGLNVIEVDGTGSPAIAGAATSVAAFNILTRRGIPNRPARITGFADYVAKFGGHFDGALGSYLVKGFFENDGAVAYVNRITASTSTVASLALSDAVPNPTLRLEAGWRGTGDPGSWGLDLYARTTRRLVAAGLPVRETAPATVVTPAPLPGATDMTAAAFPSLVVTIDGAAAATSIPFQAVQFANPATATPAEIVSAINAGTNDLDASLDAGGQLRLTSTGNIAQLSGGFTALAVQINATLGFPAAISANATTTGLRLRETAAATVVTPAALPATTNMTAAAFPSLLVTIDGGATPTSIPFQAAQFVNPAAATPAEIVSAINAGTDNLDASLEATGELRLTSTANVALMSGGFTALAVQINATLGFPAALNAGATTSALGAGGATLHSVAGIKTGDVILLNDGSPPANVVKIQSVNQLTRAITWAPAVLPGDYNPLLLRISTLEFDLEIFQGGVDVAQNRVEVWPGLSMESDVANYVVAVLNNTATGSKFVRAVDLASASGIGLDRPANLTIPLQFNTGGVDGVATSTNFIGDAAAHTGFYAFDTFDVQLVTCERTDAAIAAAGISYCEARDDCMYVGALPEGALDAGTALAYGQALQGTKRYGALYAPWVLVADPIGLGDAPTKLIPPVGHVMGVYARIERIRGIWKAPAGDEARLRNVLDVPYRMTDIEHTQLVREGGINGIRALPRAGVVVDASRTLSTDPRWLFVNVRLLFNFVKSSLRQGLRWVRQEPNRDRLWNSVVYGSVRPFLMQLWRQGAFGTGKPADVFTIICDASNNPPDQIQLGFLTVEIYFYPTVPAETIVVKVGQQPSGATSSKS